MWQGGQHRKDLSFGKYWLWTTHLCQVFGVFSIFNFSGTVLLRGTTISSYSFPHSERNYYSVCVELTKEMPTVSHLVTSPVLRLSAKSCKSYLNVLNNSTFDKTPQNSVEMFKVKWPSFSETESKFQSLVLSQMLHI